MNNKNKCWCGSEKDYEACHKSLDEKLEQLKKQGNIVPPHSLIKNEKQIAGIREAGRINSLVLDAVQAKIRAGISTEEIDKIVYNETIRLDRKSVV